MAAKRWRDETALGSPGQVDPRAASRWLRYVRPLVRLAFRPRFEGVENLPTDGPYMLVANHSGGGNAEIISPAVSFLERRDSAPNLWRSDRVLPSLLILARLMGMKCYALTLLGALGATLLVALGPIWTWWLTAILAWLWLVLPFATLPWIPSSITMRVGKAIPLEELFPDDSEATLDRAYERGLPIA